ncbi:MAG: LytTR family DNA-binding domain-containing protein [Bacteroidales bacterium]|nr:LytTR family DNA-binding domain-containing protein [Bacteroidales bacterium]
MKNLDHQPQNLLKEELGRIFIISFGVFLFILFFQPFPLETLDYNNRLLYVAGFGGITFLISVFILVGLPLLMPKWFKISEWESGPPFILNALLLLLTATAFAFYIRFAGNSNLSLYVIFKMALVCLLPIIILVILYKNKSQERMINLLRDQNKANYLKINEMEKGSEDKEIKILSSNKTDQLLVQPKNIVVIQSADNYIEIYFLANDTLEKKIIRNTLKDVELQLALHQSIIRCHRTTLVNIRYIDAIHRGYSGYRLKIRKMDEKIPVSRQYVIPLKEAFSTLKVK